MGAQPLFTNDAIILGILIIILAVIFKTASSQHKFWKKFYIYVPALLLCYFIPAIFQWPLGLIAPHWYDLEGLSTYLITNHGATFGPNASWTTLESFITANQIDESVLLGFEEHSQLYFMASRYLYPLLVSGSR